MGEYITVCPSCDSARIYSRGTGMRDDTEDAYRCVDCDHEFDAPKERLRLKSKGARVGLAKKLENTDPEDVT